MPPQGVPVSNTVPPPGGQPIPGPYLPIGYPPAYYGQYAPLVAKQGEGAPMYSSPPYYLAPVPHPMQPQIHPVPDAEAQGYPQGFYQTAVLTPMSYHHPQYAIPRQDGASMTNQYQVYGTPIYPKHHMGGQGDLVNDGQELVVNSKQV